MIEFIHEYQIVCICDRKILVHNNITYQHFIEMLMKGNWQVADILELENDILIITIEPVSGYAN